MIIANFIMITSNVTLSPLYAKKLFPNANFENCSDFRIKSCRYNASSIEPGEVYVAMEDPSVDPSGVELARKQGAAAIIVRNQFAFCDACDCLADIPVCRVENPHAAYAEICQALYDSPGKKLQIIGVAGGRGRRVVSYLIANLLSQTGRKTGILTECGATIINSIEAARSPKNMDEFCQLMSEIVKSYPSSMPGLAPKKSAYWLSRMVQNECNSVVMEVSQTALDKSNCAGIPFHSGCVTLIDPDKDSMFESVSRVQLLDQLDEKGCVILNGDAPLSGDTIQRIHGPVLTYGLGGNCQVHGTILEQNPGEQIALITAGSQTSPLRTRIVGQDYLYYCLCAVAFGLTLSISLTDIIRIIESVTIIPGCMQLIRSPYNFPVYLVQDLSNSDDPLEEKLKTIQSFVSGRILNVLPIPVWSPLTGENEFNPKVYRPKRDRVYLVGNRSDNPDFVDALERRLGDRVEIFTAKQDAIHAAAETAKRTDALVCAGCDNFHKALAFDVQSDEELFNL